MVCKKFFVLVLFGKMGVDVIWLNIFKGMRGNIKFGNHSCKQKQATLWQRQACKAIYNTRRCCQDEFMSSRI